MIEDIPWIIQKIPTDKIEEANDLGAEGWQPFAVADGHIYYRRIGTTVERVRIPICCGTCNYFAPVGKRDDNEVTFGTCTKRRHATNENHYCDEYESIHV